MSMQNAKKRVEHTYFSSHAGAAVDNEKSLPKQAALLLVVHGLYAVANALSGTFVNVYLWKVSNDLTLIAWFTVAGQLANTATFFLGGKWVKEFNKMNSLRLGVALSAVFYLAVLLLQKSAVDYVVWLGALQGMAGGFFWLAFNVVYFEVTGPFNRDKFNGWAGLLGSFSTMLAPWFSGFLISRMKDATGYRIIFTLSLGVFLIGAIVSFFLKKRKVVGKYMWFHGFRDLADKGNAWRQALPALAAQGTREGVFTFIIGLLVFIATNNEMKLGNYSLITSAVGLFAFWLTGKFLRPHVRHIAMFWGTLAMSALILPFFWDVNYTTLLIFGIGTALFFPLFSVPMTSSVFDMIGQDKETAKHRVEYVVLREMGLNAGRLFGTLGFIIVVSASKSPFVLNVFLLVVGSFSLVAWFFMRKLLTR